MSRLALAAAICLIFAGCDDGAEGSRAGDPGMDAAGGGEVADSDSESEADSDSESDSEADSEAESGPDSESDSGPDSDSGAGPDSVVAGACPPLPSGVTAGFELGDRLGSRTFKDCDGKPVDLQSLCGADGAWLFFAHGWCPHCQKATGFMESVWSSYAADGLVAVNVLVATGSNGVPSAASCREWRDTFGLSGVLTLYDDDGSSQVLWDNNFTALSVFVDRDWVVVKKAHTDVEAQIRNVLEILLGLVK